MTAIVPGPLSPAVLDAATDPDHVVKRERVLGVLDRAGADAVWLTSPTAVGWYLEGARVHTSLAGPPIAAVRIDRSGDLVRVFSNEADRLVAEELPAGLTVEPVAWHDALVPHEPGVVTEAALDRELRGARAVLLPAECARFAALGGDTARALTDVLSAARPDRTERDLAADLACAVTADGSDALVVMVAGAERLGHRHPLPTDAVLGERAMVVVCARRSGLVANATRWVRFAPQTPAEQRDETAIRAVESDAWQATRPGRTLGAVLDDIAAAYPRHGFAAEEWRSHHQGGAAGYAGRDPRASPGATDLVHDGQAFAWNPSAPGTKIEDTVILDSGAVDVLTNDPRWPATVVDGVARPDELRL